MRNACALLARAERRKTRPVPLAPLEVRALVRAHVANRAVVRGVVAAQVRLRPAALVVAPRVGGAAGRAELAAVLPRAVIVRLARPPRHLAAERGPFGDPRLAGLDPLPVALMLARAVERADPRVASAACAHEPGRETVLQLGAEHGEVRVGPRRVGLARAPRAAPVAAVGRAGVAKAPPALAPGGPGRARVARRAMTRRDCFDRRRGRREGSRPCRGCRRGRRGRERGRFSRWLRRGPRGARRGSRPRARPRRGALGPRRGRRRRLARVVGNARAVAVDVGAVHAAGAVRAARPADVAAHYAAVRLVHESVVAVRALRVALVLERRRAARGRERGRRRARARRARVGRRVWGRVHGGRRRRGRAATDAGHEADAAIAVRARVALALVGGRRRRERGRVLARVVGRRRGRLVAASRVHTVAGARPHVAPLRPARIRARRPVFVEVAVDAPVATWMLGAARALVVPPAF